MENDYPEYTSFASNIIIGEHEFDMGQGKRSGYPKDLQ